MKKIIKIAIGSASLLPFMAFAQTAPSNFDGGDYVGGFLGKVYEWVNFSVTILIVLAVAWFIWNVVSYTMSSDDKKKEAAKSQMIWGIIAIAVIVSVWGLVTFLQGFFGVDKTNSSEVIPSDYIPTVTH